MKGAIPPDGVIEIEPLFPPEQITFVIEDASAIGAGCIIVTEFTEVHPILFVIVTE